MERADPIEFQSNKPSAPPGQASGVVQEPTGSQIPLSSIIGDGSQGQTAISNPDSETNRASTLQTRLTRPDLSISRDLWDVAYDALQESHPLLLNEYEKILSSRLRGPEDDARGEQPINLIDRTDNDRRRQQMIDVIRLGIQKLEETLKTALETNHGKFIARMKDDIRSAIQDTPEVAIPWVGCVLVLNELPRRGWTGWTRNPDQRRGASQMLDLCSTMNFFCDLPKVLLQNGLAEYNDRFSQALRTDIRELILNQYRAILLFQIQLLYSCYRTSGFQLADLGNISADWGPVALARESLTHGQRDLLPHSVGLAAVGVCGICDKIRELLLLAILTLGVRTAHLHLSQGGGNDDDTKATDSTFIDALSEFVEQFISSHPPAMDKTLFEIHWSFSSSRRLRPPTSVITTTCLRVAANIIGLESLLRQIQQHYASTEISAEIAEITETLLQSLLPQGKQAVREYFRIYIRERTSMAYTLDPVIKDTSVTTEVNSPCRGGPAALSADATQPDAAKHNVIGLVIAVDGDGMTAADGRDFINIFGPGDWNQRLEAVDNRRVVNHPNVPASDQFSLPHPIVARAFVPEACIHSHRPLKLPLSTRVLIMEHDHQVWTPSLMQLTTEEIDLSDGSSAPEYLAFSYSWGDQKPSVPVFCDGKLLFVTKNCQRLLHNFHRLHSVSTRESQDPVTWRVWIDQICIDQTSKEEKSRQVSIMDKIYKRAGKVLVDPGQCDLPTRRLVHQLSRIPGREDPHSKMKCFDGEILGEDSTSSSNEMTDEECSSMSQIPWTKEFADHVFGEQKRLSSNDRIYRSQVTRLLGNFLSKSWFTRTWTIQEIVLSGLGRQFIVMSGGDSITCCYFTVFAYVVWSLGTKFRLAALKIPYQAAMYPIWIQSMLGKEDDFQLRLSPLLLGPRWRECLEPRDRIFALYGTLRDHFPDFPKPNYKKSVVDVYTEAAAFCLNVDREKAKNLDLLYAAPRSAYGQRIDGLPSWVPDFSQPSVYAHRTDRNAPKPEGFDFPGEGGSKFHFSASGTSSPCCHIALDQKILRLSGKFVRSIKAVGWAAPPRDHDDGAARLLFGNAVNHTLLQWALMIDSTGMPWRGVLYRYQRVVHEWAKHDRISRSQRYGLVTGLHQLLVELHESSVPFNPYLGELLAKDHVEITPLGGVSWPIAAEHSLVMDSDNQIGLVMGDIEEGDKITLISGMEIPVILREAGNGRWTLTGYGYFYGLMEGQQWDDQANLVDIDII